MLPVTLLVVEKLADLLNAGQAFQNAQSALFTLYRVSAPMITTDNVVLSAASESMADMSIELGYPRLALYATQIRNSHLEKYRPLSGMVAVSADVYASGDLLDQVGLWMHFYVEALAGILRQNAGDLGDGVFYNGSYDVRFEPPKTGGLGFLQIARISLNMIVSGS